MYRIALPAVLAIILGACSLGPIGSTSFAPDSSTGSIAGSSTALATNPVGLGSDGSRRRGQRQSGRQVAALSDNAPRGSFERAPAGALADRDYSKTALDVRRARDLINAYRRANGLRPLKLNALLSRAAQAHSKDLAKWDRISHFGSDGSNPWDRVKRAGYNAKVAAENVGTGQASFEEVLKGWKESPGHNRNLLMRDVREMGIALVRAPQTEFKTFWTLVFGTRL